MNIKVYTSYYDEDGNPFIINVGEIVAYWENETQFPILKIGQPVSFVKDFCGINYFQWKKNNQCPLYLAKNI